MSIPETNFDPPFNLTRANHVRLSTPDLEASRAFYEENIGLVVSDADVDNVYMRGVEAMIDINHVPKRWEESKRWGWSPPPPRSWIDEASVFPGVPLVEPDVRQPLKVAEEVRRAS